MKPAFLILIIFILSSACRNTPNSKEINIPDSEQYVDKRDSASSNQITCWGIGEIDFDDDLNSIEEKIGDSNVSIDSLFLEGDFERMVSVLWKGTPKEVAVNWTEKQPPFKIIKFLEVSHPSSVYSFANGIKIGTTLNELEKLNAASFNLYGFGWDYGGTFIDFGKGRLGEDLPCFGGVFTLEGNAPQSVTGDKPFGSDYPAFKNREISLRTIRIKNLAIN